MTDLTSLLTWRLCRASGRAVLVRHGEPLAGGSDPSLSAAGQARASELAETLAAAGVVKIITSNFARTQETAAPLATHLGLTPVVIPALDVAAIVAAVKAAKGLAVVVGHSNTVPDVVDTLCGTSLPDIPSVDFDHLYVVQQGAVAQLRYGA